MTREVSSAYSRHASRVADQCILGTKPDELTASELVSLATDYSEQRAAAEIYRFERDIDAEQNARLAAENEVLKQELAAARLILSRLAAYAADPMQRALALFE